MRALTWHGKHDVRVETVPDPRIINARDAIIRITATAAGDRARIAVADDGPGMSQQQQQLAFRRFATSNGGGTGLGLAIVDRLTVASGGTASLSDTPGGGLTVTIELPLVRPDRGQRRHAAASRARPV